MIDMPSNSDILIETSKLTKLFLASKFGILDRITGVKPLYVRAVDGVNIKIKNGQTVTLVGESGSGKTTLGRLLATIEKPTSGEIFYEGMPIRQNLKAAREHIQIVYQNPFESLDPRMDISAIVEEPLLGKKISKEERKEKVKQALESVGLDYSYVYFRKAKDLSGGQRQRVAIARAIISNPRFIVLDEPTSALDASIQSQVLNLLVDLKVKFGYTYLVITHNMMVTKYIADEVYVMYAGKIIETGNVDIIMKTPKHPYTQLLLKSIPSLENRKLEPMVGEPPSLINPPSGCRFHPRCPYAFDRCKVEEPELKEVEPGHWVACHLY